MRRAWWPVALAALGAAFALAIWPRLSGGPGETRAVPQAEPPITGQSIGQNGEADDEFEADIQEFERQDLAMPPRPGGVLFFGSSTIRDWDLAHAFPAWEPLNRGFGGSQIEHAVRYMDRVVLPCRPRLVVFYGGDNDLNAGKSVERVEADFRQFADRLLRELPSTRLMVLSIKPSPARWKLYPLAEQVNARMKAYCAEQPRCQYEEVGHMLLGSDGKPDARWYKDDGLHVNAAAYKRWAEQLIRNEG